MTKYFSLTPYIQKVSALRDYLSEEAFAVSCLLPQFLGSVCQKVLIRTILKPLRHRLGSSRPTLYFSTVNLYFCIMVAGCTSQYLSLRDTESNLCVYSLGMTNGKEYVHVQKCQNVDPPLCASWICVCLHQDHRGCKRSIPLQDVLKSFILIFLVEVAQFSRLAHEKLDVQVLKEVKSESSDYSCMDEDDPLW